MKTSIRTLLAASILVLNAAANPARAHSTASELSALSALPVASVVVGAGASLAVPVVLSTTGAVLVVEAVEVTAQGMVLVLESASDGARMSLEIMGGGLASSSILTGTVLTVSVIGSGTVLSAAGEAIAFIPNAIGNALLYNERVTY